MPPFNPEFFLPVLIGIGCLIFSMRILLRSDRKEPQETEAPIMIDSDHDDLEETLSRRHEEKLEPGRKVFYFLLFAGLGAASIVFGFAAIHPVLGYAAKGIIILTIIASIIVNAQMDKNQLKQQAKEQEEKSLEEKKADN